MTAADYRAGYALIKWAPIKPSGAKPQESKASAPYVVPDIAEFIAPGHVPISSRSRLREYERDTGTRQCGELKSVADFDPRLTREHKTDDHAIDRAFREALQKVRF